MESNEQAVGKLPWELVEIFSFKLERDRSHTAQDSESQSRIRWL